MPVTLSFHTDDGAAEVQYAIDSQWIAEKCAYPGRTTRPSRHPCSALLSRRSAPIINQYRRDCPTTSMLLPRKMVHITHQSAPLSALHCPTPTEKTRLKIGALP